MNPDHTYDVVVVGSGAAAFSAAIAAADGGAAVVMLESTDRWGGSSAMSGGGLWLPNNPLMQRDGAADSREEALDYLERTVGDAGPATSRARKEAFVDNVGGFVALAERLGVRFARSADYPDYYPELPGGKIGRAIEVQPFDIKRIDDWWASSRGQDGVPAPAMTDDFWLLQRSWSSLGGAVRGARVVGRVAAMLLRRQHKVGMGAALTASLLTASRELGIPLWLDCPVTELIVEDDRVVGVRAQRAGEEITVAATRGVVLAGGGFDHNTSWRERHHGIDGSASSGSRGNLGGPIAAAERAGAAIDLMDDAWWGGSIPPATPEGSAAFLVSERAMPFSLIVDAAGDRFANEAESYVDLGHHMRAHAERVPGRFWMIADVRHARRYLRSYALDPRATKAMTAAGIRHQAGTLAELARALGVEPARLEATVARFNGFARTGIDQDFGRGNSAYDRYYSDPNVRPNPNLGPLEKCPFTAVELVAGDLGTKGGVLTDERARALRPDGTVIPGLYAAGNNSASVMGRTYPGPGSTLGPAAVFGFIAGRELARRA
ncbi:FAD-dependent oxidoreductase [Propioniciclava coleopterorum]|uniref:FAD-dependent oxidoreductase n=1 Tax=Propioniciclava coleopterorum TaxID=2714937 RepID=A0A6G7Y3W1_9ACTN|nr:FAD-binding protein [Propioniciclava coleopterorum]QIK71510.1 FAD-dependent oxidoreductase [Propioniciclava coleopterorum]